MVEALTVAVLTAADARPLVTAVERVPLLATVADTQLPAMAAVVTPHRVAGRPTAVGHRMVVEAEDPTAAVVAAADMGGNLRWVFSSVAT